MQRRAELHILARQEVAEAFDWYLSRSVDAAERFLQELEHGLELIVQMPETWQESIASTRGYPLRSFPFTIFYRSRGDVVLVVAVAHQKRRPGYWRDR